MSYFKLNSIYTVIDIGTTKICTIIAQKLADNTVDILGVGICPSHGLSKGMVVDIGQAAESIKHSLQEARIMASFNPDSACIGISGSHIKSYYSQGMTPIVGSIIKSSTITNALNTSKTISLPENEQLLHSVPIIYTIDGITQVQNPLGMHGMRLEVTSHIITSNSNAIQDLIYCCELAGIKVYDIVLEPIASGFAVLNNDEKNIGTMMVDIGGGTSDVAFYYKGALQYTHIIPIAGELFTSDLSACARIKKEEAEALKKEFGIVFDAIEQFITVNTIDGGDTKTLSSHMISEILLARTEELLYTIISLINSYYPLHPIPSGVVFTGGGSLLKGFDEVAERMLKLPVRIGIPAIQSLYKGSLEHPSFTTAYGLILYTIAQENSGAKPLEKESSIGRLFWHVRNWLETII